MEEIKEILKAPIEVLLVLAILALVTVVTKLTRKHNGTERRTNAFTDEQRKYIDDRDEHKSNNLLGPIHDIQERLTRIEDKIDGYESRLSDLSERVAVMEVKKDP